VAGIPLLRDVILRDGTPLRLRTPTLEDYDAIKSFYDGLSEDSLYQRFHGWVRTEGPARSDAEADGDARVVLIGWRADRVVASGGYDRLREPAVAEVAFTVADNFQGHGVATRILEQLAEIGAARGIERFDAEVAEANASILRVFRRAGFGVRSKLDYDELLVSLDIHPTEGVRERIEERDHVGIVASLRSILAPASVAVAGASNEPGSATSGSQKLAVVANKSCRRGDKPRLITLKSHLRVGRNATPSARQTITKTPALLAVASARLEACAKGSAIPDAIPQVPKAQATVCALSRASTDARASGRVAECQAWPRT
jgi:RimJ/RimL family protein N-acetyltransferase